MNELFRKLKATTSPDIYVFADLMIKMFQEFAIHYGELRGGYNDAQYARAKIQKITVMKSQLFGFIPLMRGQKVKLFKPTGTPMSAESILEWYTEEQRVLRAEEVTIPDDPIYTSRKTVKI